MSSEESYGVRGVVPHHILRRMREEATAHGLAIQVDAPDGLSETLLNGLKGVIDGAGFRIVEANNSGIAPCVAVVFQAQDLTEIIDVGNVEPGTRFSLSVDEQLHLPSQPGTELVAWRFQASTVVHVDDVAGEVDEAVARVSGLCQDINAEQIAA